MNLSILNLLQNHKGKENAIPGLSISLYTGISYKKVQEDISKMVNDNNILIASCDKGYYLPIRESEMAEEIKRLKHRGIKVFRRASRFAKTSLEDILNQVRMEFKE